MVLEKELSTTSIPKIIYNKHVFFIIVIIFHNITVFPVFVFLKDHVTLEGWMDGWSKSNIIKIKRLRFLQLIICVLIRF